MMTNFRKLLFFIVLVAIFSILSGMMNPNPLNFNLRNLEKSLVLIPEGKYDLVVDSNDHSKGSLRSFLLETHHGARTILPEGKDISIKAFYLSRYEVTNREYQNFLLDVKGISPAMFEEMYPDTSMENYPFSYGMPVIMNYFHHPAFHDYPVNGISYNQATSYCEWLTQRYNSEEKRKFKKAKFRLPTVAEWTYAAMGRSGFSMFPWEGLSMRNKKGEWLANFKAIEQRQIGKFEMENGPPDYFTGLMAIDDISEFNIGLVNSGQANTFGLYHMAGNVEEYVLEKGITKGGSWNDTGYYLQTWVEQRYDSTNRGNDENGFRIAMEELD